MQCSLSPGVKAPGPDGYNSSFFKMAWPVIGEDIISAVQQFFENGKLLKELNCTTLTLIPKVDAPTSVLDFRPSCNVLYKCITKLLCVRLKKRYCLASYLLIRLALRKAGRSFIISISFKTLWADMGVNPPPPLGAD